VNLVEERLRTLDPVFSYARARRAGLSKRAIYRLRDQGLIEPVGRGIYRRADAPPADLDLLEIVARAPRATLCLATALARHGLCDLIPAAVGFVQGTADRPIKGDRPHASPHAQDRAAPLYKVSE
jgi:predicted transcriptional regulator of viral defense system